MSYSHTKASEGDYCGYPAPSADDDEGSQPLPLGSTARSSSRPHPHGPDSNEQNIDHAPDFDLNSVPDLGAATATPTSTSVAALAEPAADDDMTNPLHPGRGAAGTRSSYISRPGEFDLNSVSTTSLPPAAQPPQRQSTDVQSEGVPTELLAFNQRYAEDVASQRSAGGASTYLQAQASPVGRRGPLVAPAAAPGGGGGGGFNPFQPGGGKAARRNQRKMRREAVLDDLRARLEHAQQEKISRHAMRTIEYEEKLEKYRQHRYPAPGTVALCSCGMATTILNYPNTGFFTMSTNVPAMQIFFAGVAQTIAGIFEWINGVTFAHTAFLTYAAFHMSISMMILIPNAEIFADNKNSFYYVDRIANPNGFADTTTYFLGTYQILFAIHSFALWSCTPTMNIVIFILLFNVFLTYLLQGTANMMGHKPLLHASGWSGIVSGGIMVYFGLSETLNTVWDRTILPTFPFMDFKEKRRKQKELKAQSLN